MKSKVPSLRREITNLKAENRKLHKECRKYRVALNRIAYPEVWGLKPNSHVKIATKALVDYKDDDNSLSVDTPRTP